MEEKTGSRELITADFDDKVMICGPAKVVRQNEDDFAVLYILKSNGTSVLIKPWQLMPPGKV